VRTATRSRPLGIQDELNPSALRWRSGSRRSSSTCSRRSTT
jgi:hypothetical protein